MNARKIISILICVIFIGVFVVGCTGQVEKNQVKEGQTEEGKKETASLLLGTSGVGGTYYVWGGGWASIINETLPEVEITVEAGGGPISNIQLIQNEEMDIGFVTTWLAGEGYYGKGWTEGKKHDRIRALFPMYASYLHLYTKQSSGIETVYDYSGKNVSMGSPGSTSDKAGRAVLDVLGIKPKSVSAMSSSTAVNAQKDGTIDASFNVTGAPGPFMLDFESTHEVRLIELSDEDFNKIINEYPFWSVGKIPAGTYKCLKDDYKALAFWNFAVCSKDLPEDLVYNIVKATFDKKEDMMDVDPTAKELSPENYSYSTVPFHPGAVKYYKEKGFDIPDNLIPPEMK